MNLKPQASKGNDQLSEETTSRMGEIFGNSVSDRLVSST